MQPYQSDVPGAARTVEDLRKARESRAADALLMKDEQISILYSQGTHLSKLLEVVELEKRSIQDANLELQRKASACDTQLKHMQADVADKDKQLSRMTDQILYLLEAEQRREAHVDREVQMLRGELDELRQKPSSALLVTAISREDTELKMKTQAEVEVEELQEKLRVRKEKQYQLLEKCEQMDRKMTEINESNRLVVVALGLKHEEYQELKVKYDHLLRESVEKAEKGDEAEEEEDGFEMIGDERKAEDKTVGARLAGLKDSNNARQNDGRGHFLAVQRVVAGSKSVLQVEEEVKQLQKAITEKDNQLALMSSKIKHVQRALATEQDAKLRVLLRYVHSVEEHALAVNGGTGGIINLSASNISDEELHALAALLRNNLSIEELNLRGNSFTDDGARALGAVLAGPSALRVVDLRDNKISTGVKRELAETLDSAERVRHVYCHARGKIEALGVTKGAAALCGADMKNSVGKTAEGQDPHVTKLETVCVVDCRDNHAVETFSLNV